MLAKAVATEAKVPFLAMAGSEFIEMIGGKCRLFLLFNINFYNCYIFTMIFSLNHKWLVQLLNA